MLWITPTGKQEVVRSLAEDHIAVPGTAGSGKIAIALLRAHHLANISGGE
jgi:DNA helicase IV